MQKLLLFSSKDCQLCEEAQELFHLSPLRGHFDLEKRDIYQDKALLLRYKWSIPVLADEKITTELKWPFEQFELDTWLASMLVGEQGAQ